jgi:ABC-type Mn2+/Zn2+ transport system ATPase subunit
MNEKKFLEFIDVDFTYPPVEEYDENGEVFVQESKPVFEHFSAELPEGFVSLVGPNASGKSTLMMLASGRLCPTSGMIKLFETDTREFFPAIKITKTEDGESQEIAQPRRSEEENQIDCYLRYIQIFKKRRTHQPYYRICRGSAGGKTSCNS